MVELVLDAVTKRYDDAQGTETAVDDVSLSVEDELLVLLGPSGCGKTTTLRMVAGLETVTDGRIDIGGRDVTDRHPSDRSIAMVFQDYGLYTMMSVGENMAYGLKHSTDLSKAERDERVESMAEMFGIEDLLDRDVTDLSGGQKQRVALGRAMVREPDVFLLDEPLASLDAKLRSQMRTELQQLQEEMDITTMYVTHDQKEAMTMADRVAVMNDGVLRQVGPPEEVYENPVDSFVADFLGNPSMNQLPATVDRQGERYVLRTDVGDGRIAFASIPREGTDAADGDRVTVGVRPEHLRLSDPETADFDATVSVTEYQGSDNFVHVDVGEVELTAVVSPSVRPEPGETVPVTVPASAVHVFDGETGESLRTSRESDPRSKTVRS
ncbi:multiple sugar transport system ATP-binding protein [Halogeometricum rufum]|uniref:ABC-type D-xylose/L-arabinose transporter n=1 Tax=Halogeometricum rufum TaxID=553469 RepID=A0A1I6IRU5_9EURY|nr:ABC transporter ATP-binding protein [Halogeometricum rufum]SFR69465.1 multiple sugar transport system ATP-binding protein [Halogeometricum rufum]